MMQSRWQVAILASVVLVSTVATNSVAQGQPEVSDDAIVFGRVSFKDRLVGRVISRHFNPRPE